VIRPPHRLYVQGEAPRERLLEDFRADGDGVLLGTASFWEGVDVQGEALRLVIIDKLPFASPEDPLVKARVEHLQMQGGNAFRDYQLPEAALALKQGVGRLIRSEDDFWRPSPSATRGSRAGATAKFFSPRCRPCASRARSDEALKFLRRHAGARRFCPRRAAGMRILALDTARRRVRPRYCRRTLRSRANF